MYTQKRKNVYVKLHTANKACDMRAYVYVCILRKCSGWFRCADFRKFLYRFICIFFLLAAGEVCMFYMHKKETKCICLHTQKKDKMHMFTYSKFEVICIA